jgi:hypothetical protein
LQRGLADHVVDVFQLRGFDELLSVPQQ